MLLQVVVVKKQHFYFQSVKTFINCIKNTFLEKFPLNKNSKYKPQILIITLYSHKITPSVCIQLFEVVTLCLCCFQEGRVIRPHTAS